MCDRDKFEIHIERLGYVPAREGEGYLYEEVQVGWDIWNAATTPRPEGEYENLHRTIETLTKQLVKAEQGSVPDPDLQIIEQRDYWEEKSTELAEDVGKFLGIDVGEHSSANCPVQNAIDAVCNATPQPAASASVQIDLEPYIRYAKSLGIVSEAKAKIFNLVEVINNLQLTTTPQPADNWIKCSDRLPDGPDGDFNEDVWAYDKALRKSVMTCWADLEMVPEYTHWMPTGLKRPNPPAEGEE